VRWSSINSSTLVQVRHSLGPPFPQSDPGPIPNPDPNPIPHPKHNPKANRKGMEWRTP